MKIYNNEDKLVLEYEKYLVRNLDKTNEELEKILEKRRSVYMSGCPRKYMHLIDSSEWYIVSNYIPENDNEYNEALYTLIESEERLVLIDSSLRDKVNTSKKDIIRSIPMEYNDKLSLLVPIVEYDSNDINNKKNMQSSFQSEIMASYIEKTANITVDTDLKDFVNYKTDRYFDDNLIAQLVYNDIIVVSNPTKIIGGDQKEAVLIRQYDKLYLVPLTSSFNGNKMILFKEKELIEERDKIFKLGDMVYYDNNLCTIVGVHYGTALRDMGSQLYTVCNVKTGTKLDVTAMEITYTKYKDPIFEFVKK